jgi:hypothetical protein
VFCLVGPRALAQPHKKRAFEKADSKIAVSNQLKIIEEHRECMDPLPSHYNRTYRYRYSTQHLRWEFDVKSLISSLLEDVRAVTFPTSLHEPPQLLLKTTLQMAIRYALQQQKVDIFRIFPRPVVVVLQRIDLVNECQP